MKERRTAGTVTFDSPRKCVPDFCFILVAADEKSYCRIPRRGFDEIVNGIDIKFLTLALFRSFAENRPFT